MRHRRKLCAKRSKKTNTHIYRGHVSGHNQRIIIATSPNEAYALMLDALAGKEYEINEVYADPEQNRYIQAYYKRYPIGVYDPGNVVSFISQLKVI